MACKGPSQPKTCYDSVILRVLLPQVPVPRPRGVPGSLAYQKVSEVKEGSLWNGWPCIARRAAAAMDSGLFAGVACRSAMIYHWSTGHATSSLSQYSGDVKVNQNHLWTEGNSHFSAAGILLCSKSESSRGIMTGRVRSRTTTEMTNYVLWHSEMASEWLSEGTDRLCATVSSLCPLFTDGKLTRSEIAALINAVKDLYHHRGCLHGVGSHGVETLSSLKQLQLHDLS